jgi:hypothetical protein
VPHRDKAELMRSVNEGIAFFASDLEPSDPGTPDRWSFVCECGAPECVEWVDLDLGRYAEIRSSPSEAVVAEDHFPLWEHAVGREPAAAAR